MLKTSSLSLFNFSPHSKIFALSILFLALHFLAFAARSTLNPTTTTASSAVYSTASSAVYSTASSAVYLKKSSSAISTTASSAVSTNASSAASTTATSAVSTNASSAVSTSVSAPSHCFKTPHAILSPPMEYTTTTWPIYE